MDLEQLQVQEALKDMELLEMEIWTVMEMETP